MTFQVQAHRGARAGKPENTLPAFELALDLGVHSIEMDLRLTRDGQVVVFHDDAITPRLCRSRTDAELPRGESAHVWRLDASDLEQMVVNSGLIAQPRLLLPPTPLARSYLQRRNRPEFAIPTLDEVLGFFDAYSSALGEGAGKTAFQRSHARTVRLDLELKGDHRREGQLERRVVDLARKHDITSRVCIRSFDHVRLCWIKEMAPEMRTGVLIAYTRPVDAVQLVQAASAEEYYPDLYSLDAELLVEMHRAGIPVIPWTVNDEDDWQRLKDWNVAGITTDYPGELLHWLGTRP